MFYSPGSLTVCTCLVRKSFIETTINKFEKQKFLHCGLIAFGKSPLFVFYFFRKNNLFSGKLSVCIIKDSIEKDF